MSERTSRRCWVRLLGDCFGRYVQLLRLCGTRAQAGFRFLAGKRKMEHVVHQLDVFERRAPDDTRSIAVALIQRPDRFTAVELDARGQTVCNVSLLRSPGKLNSRALRFGGLFEKPLAISNRRHVEQLIQANIFLRLIHRDGWCSASDT